MDTPPSLMIDIWSDVVCPSNALDAHRVTVLANTPQLTSAMSERLFQPYFNESGLLSDRGTLEKLAGDLGVDAVPQLASAISSATSYAKINESPEGSASPGCHRSWPMGSS